MGAWTPDGFVIGSSGVREKLVDVSTDTAELRKTVWAFDIVQDEEDTFGG